MTSQQEDQTGIALNDILERAVDRIREMQQWLGSVEPGAAEQFLAAGREAERTLKFATTTALKPIRNKDGKPAFKGSVIHDSSTRSLREGLGQSRAAE
ncbi:hypothetical protein [Salinisphaera aquimarina]|uniref:Uncharacterized protein n=1 Tax=Salinisphaera aquimarina TaxID=2094031 RepID=A0ABV7ELZ5_9GAMM